MENFSFCAVIVKNVSIDDIKAFAFNPLSASVALI